MRIKQLHNSLIMPTKGTTGAGAFDIYMPEDGTTQGLTPIMVGLGFAAEVPQGNVALIFPRSSTGAKFGLELNNTCGIIDSDYRGEWKASLRTKDTATYSWWAGDRLLQFLIMPITNVILELTDELDDTVRGAGGFGSTN